MRTKLDPIDEFLKPVETKRAYTFFNLAGQGRRKRHAWEDVVTDTNIHPTVVTFKDKRVAGVSTLHNFKCLQVK